jgi:hypothetical protein
VCLEPTRKTLILLDLTGSQDVKGVELRAIEEVDPLIADFRKASLVETHFQPGASLQDGSSVVCGDGDRGQGARARPGLSRATA